MSGPEKSIPQRSTPPSGSHSSPVAFLRFGWVGLIIAVPLKAKTLTHVFLAL